MEPHDEPLRERLLAQQPPTPETLARYRAEVDALLTEIRRRRWWIDAVRSVLTIVGAIVLFPLAVLFALFALLFVAGRDTQAAVWGPAVACILCLVGGVALLRWFFRRRADDLLLEVKRLQAQGLELEERLGRERGPAGR